MPKLTITLKQNTPLIHFQCYQYGATIRASEFKPKLDKFLIKRVFKDDFDTYRKYLIGYDENRLKEMTKEYFKDREALNYKIRFYNLKRPNVDKIPDNYKNLYFGNMNKENDNIDKFIMCDTLDMEIFSFDEEVINEIAKALPEFLMINNFGKRQSKGFGSFYVNDNYEYYCNGELQKYDPKYIDKIKNKNFKYMLKGKFNSEGFMFRNILNSYKKIRQKIRKNGDPYIKLYAESKGMNWEKDAIKNKFEKNKNYNSGNTYLIKDLLGLSTSEFWTKQKFTVKKENISDKEKKIERMQSPIFFKPLKEVCLQYTLVLKIYPLIF